jgi:lipoate-protein ligase B
LGRSLHATWLGRVSYVDAWRMQEAVATRVRDGGAERLLLLEHDPVYTIGRRGTTDHLLVGPDELRAVGATVYRVDRGGDITYHGPGQVVGYPIIDLRPDRCDVHRYVRDLEEVLMRVAVDVGVEPSRVPGLTGVWVGNDKLAAIGVRIARWITSHGFAFNVTTDLSFFDLIVPCGIAGRGVTSLARLGCAASCADVEGRLVARFSEVFGRQPTEATPMGAVGAR